MRFQKEYKKAYDEIKAEKGSVNEIFALADERGSVNKNKKKAWKPVVVMAVLAVVLVMSVNIPVLAKEIEALMEKSIVEILQARYPGWSPSPNFVPKNATVSKDGVVMTVEHVAFRDREMIMELCFENEEGSDFINGEILNKETVNNKETKFIWNVDARVDGRTPEGYDMKITGYDEEEGKLYVTYTAMRHTKKVYVGENVEFSMNGLAVWNDWKENFDLSNVEKEAETRTVKLPIGSFESNIVKTESTEYPYMVEVLNQTPLSEINPKEMAVTGIAYMDGMLRVQICYGERETGEDYDSFGMIERYNEKGEEVFPEPSEQINWYERVDGKWVRFMEFYFDMTEEEAKRTPLTVNYWKTEGLPDTQWEVEFEIEE